MVLLRCRVCQLATLVWSTDFKVRAEYQTSQPMLYLIRICECSLGRTRRSIFFVDVDCVDDANFDTRRAPVLHWVTSSKWFPAGTFWVKKWGWSQRHRVTTLIYLAFCPCVMIHRLQPLLIVLLWIPQWFRCQADVRAFGRRIQGKRRPSCNQMMMKRHRSSSNQRGQNNDDLSHSIFKPQQHAATIATIKLLRAGITFSSDNQENSKPIQYYWTRQRVSCQILFCVY